MHRLVTPALRALAAVAAGGAGCLAYAAAYEVRAFRLRRFEVPVLPPGSRPIRLLHLSDMHLTATQEWKIDWVRGLAALEPDLVVNTGDNFALPDAAEATRRALGPLLELPGVFVFGSNDYFAARRSNPLRYLQRRGHGPRALTGPRLPTEGLRATFADAGWLDLTNSRGQVSVDGRLLAFAGVDDPHIGWDCYDKVSGPAEPGAVVRIGVTHAPYRRVLDAFVADGYDLLLAGHTHGGQVCLPLWGALVANCDLPTDRVRGLSRWGPAWLHVTAGLGTSPYAPVRFACPPEASLLTLRAPE